MWVVTYRPAIENGAYIQKDKEFLLMHKLSKRFYFAKR